MTISLLSLVDALPCHVALIKNAFSSGALCIALGLYFNYAIWLHIIPYWYTFVLDKTTWNNHTYLFGLVRYDFVVAVVVIGVVVEVSVSFITAAAL